MARIVTITVGSTESVNTEAYVYVKPTISLTAEVGANENYDDVFADLNQELKERMDIMIAQIKANNG